MSLRVYKTGTTNIRFYKFAAGEVFIRPRTEWRDGKYRPNVCIGRTLDNRMICVSLSTQEDTTKTACYYAEYSQNPSNLKTFLLLHASETTLQDKSYCDANSVFVTDEKTIVTEYQRTFLLKRILPVPALKKIVSAVLHSPSVEFRIKEALVKQYPDCV